VGVDDDADHTAAEVATDLDWSRGGGPSVRGRGEALLMVMAGRGDALKDLGGPGRTNSPIGSCGFDLRRWVAEKVFRKFFKKCVRLAGAHCSYL
jgi:hypothetical protein